MVSTAPLQVLCSPRDARAVRWGLWDDSAQSGSTGAGLRDLEEKVSLRKEVSFNIHLLVYVFNYRKKTSI